MSCINFKFTNPIFFNAFIFTIFLLADFSKSKNIDQNSNKNFSSLIVQSLLFNQNYLGF